MRLKAVYAVWAAAIGAIVVAALAMFAAGESRRASEAHARERAGLMADIVHQSFLSLTHSSGGVSDMEEFASLLEEGPNYLVLSRVMNLPRVRVERDMNEFLSEVVRSPSHESEDEFLVRDFLRDVGGKFHFPDGL